MTTVRGKYVITFASLFAKPVFHYGIRCAV